jgi:hypothetical protein
MKQAFVMLALLTATASAEPRWLNAKDLTFVLVGREVAGAYANGVTFHETYRRNGKTEYKDQKNKLEGTWSIKDNAFCTDYAPNGGGCFKVTRLSENCFEFWVQTAQGTVEANWIARTSQIKYPSTCPKQ